MPVVHADNPEDPGARAACGADLHHRLVKNAGVELEAAIPPWLQCSKESSLLEVGKGLFGESA